MNATHPSDPTGCVLRLQTALEDPDLKVFAMGSSPGSHALNAAWEVAAALGTCRLFGDSSSLAQQILPQNVAIAATTRARAVVTDLRGRAVTLPEDWENCETDIDGEGLSATIIEDRMDLWAVLVVTFEAGNDEFEDEATTDSLLSQVEQLQQEVDDLDELLEQRLDILCDVCGLMLLDNWRTALAEPFSRVLPWWLDGRLEKEVERVRKENGYVPGLNDVVTPAVRFIWLSDVGIRRLITQTKKLVADPGEDVNIIARCVWDSPDGQFRAISRIPDQADLTDEFQLQILFGAVDAADASTLSGQLLQFGSFEVRISGGLEAIVPVAVLDQFDGEVPFLVEGAEWSFALRESQN